MKLKQIANLLNSKQYKWTVTGAAGFIGSHLVEFLLENNQKVIGLAKRVKNQSDKYKSQLRECQKRLNKNKYIIF